MPGSPGAVEVWARRTRGGFVDPSSLSGLELWLKAGGTYWQDAARSTPASSDTDPVGAWDDASGNGRHFTQGTAGDRPLLRTAFVNGHAAVQFDGVSDYLDGPDAFSGLTAAEVFLVVIADDETPVGGNPTGLWRFGTDTVSTHFPYEDGNIYDQFGTTARKSTGNPTPSLESWRLYNVVTVGGEWTSFIDGTQHYTTATNTVGFSALCTLGRNVHNGDFFGGKVAELILYSSKLDAGDKANVKTYIADKFGLTIA